jgi:hypothetical protein
MGLQHYFGRMLRLRKNLMFFKTSEACPELIWLSIDAAPPLGKLKTYQFAARRFSA